MVEHILARYETLDSISKTKAMSKNQLCTKKEHLRNKEGRGRGLVKCEMFTQHLLYIISGTLLLITNCEKNRK